jgi:Ca2+-binding EF-hand superfamily protein
MWPNSSGDSFAQRTMASRASSELASTGRMSAVDLSSAGTALMPPSVDALDHEDLRHMVYTKNPNFEKSRREFEYANSFLSLNHNCMDAVASQEVAKVPAHKQKRNQERNLVTLNRMDARHWMAKRNHVDRFLNDGERDETVEQIERLFDLIDRTRDGVISITELRDSLTFCGLDPKKRHLYSLLELADISHDGDVNKSELVTLLSDPKMNEQINLKWGADEILPLSLWSLALERRQNFATLAEKHGHGARVRSEYRHATTAVSSLQDREQKGGGASRRSSALLEPPPKKDHSTGNTRRAKIDGMTKNYRATIELQKKNGTLRFLPHASKVLQQPAKKPKKRFDPEAETNKQVDAVMALISGKQFSSPFGLGGEAKKQFRHAF